MLILRYKARINETRDIIVQTFTMVVKVRKDSKGFLYTRLIYPHYTVTHDESTTVATDGWFDRRSPLERRGE